MLMLIEGPGRVIVDGEDVGTVELVDVSVGCREHHAPICTLVRTEDGRDLHIPGGLCPLPDERST
jgi:hypothetical protein